MNKKNICLLIISFVILILLILFPFSSDDSITYEQYNRAPLDPLKKGDIITQLFVSDDNYDYLGIAYADYANLIKKGNIIVTITNENNKSKKIKVPTKTLFDNSNFFVKYKLKKNKKYVLKLENNSNSKITFYTTEAKIDNAKLLNDETNTKNLVLSFKKTKKNYGKVGETYE